MSKKASLSFSRPRNNAPSAFSLVEVVLAIGVFAITIVTVLGLLTPLAREVREIRDRQAASKTTGAIDQELNRLGYEAFVDVNTFTLEREVVDMVVRYDGSLATINPDTPGLEGADSDEAFRANRREIPAQNQYFLARAETFPDGSLAFREAPDPDAHVAFRVTVVWPFRDPGFSDREFPELPGDDRDDPGRAIQDWADENRLSTFTYNTAIVIGQNR